MLNNTQRQILNVTFEYFFDDIVDELAEDKLKLSPSEQLNLSSLGIAAITDDDIYKKKSEEFKKLGILGYIDDARKILIHPCPQNRSTGSPYLGSIGCDANGCKNGRVYYEPNGHGKGIKDEPQGILGLTGQNDNTAEPIGKVDVVQHVKLLVEAKMGLLMKKSLLANNQNNQNNQNSQSNSNLNNLSTFNSTLIPNQNQTTTTTASTFVLGDNINQGVFNTNLNSNSNFFNLVPSNSPNSIQSNSTQPNLVPTLSLEAKKLHVDLMNKFAEELCVKHNEVFKGSAVEQALVGQAGVYENENNAMYRPQDNNNTYFLLIFSSKNSYEQFLKFYKDKYADFKDKIVGTAASENKYKIVFNTKLLLDRISSDLGVFKNNSHLSLMKVFAEELKVNFTAVAQQDVVESTLVEMAGIKNTEQKQAEYRANPDYSTRFTLKLNPSQRKTFKEYYDKEFSGLILEEKTIDNEWVEFKMSTMMLMQKVALRLGLFKNVVNQTPSIVQLQQQSQPNQIQLNSAQTNQTQSTVQQQVDPSPNNQSSFFNPQQPVNQPQPTTQQQPISQLQSTTNQP